MEKFQELREEALKNLKAADHMLIITYPLVGDTKILLNVMDNIFLALSNSMGAILHYERLFKQIPPFNDNFEGKFMMFKNKCMKRYNIDLEYVKLIQEIKETIVLHKNSPVEFKRQDRYIICTDNYRMVAITVNMLKNYLKKTKEFITMMQLITRKNERIFK